MTALDELLKILDLEKTTISAIQNNPQNILLSMNEKTFEGIIGKLKDQNFVFRAINDSNNFLRLYLRYSSKFLKIELLTLKVFYESPEFKKSIEGIFLSN